MSRFLASFPRYFAFSRCVRVLIHSAPHVVTFVALTVAALTVLPVLSGCGVVKSVADSPWHRAGGGMEGLTGFAFADASRGWYLNFRTLFETRDGGKTWRQSDGTLVGAGTEELPASIADVNVSIIVCRGGSVYAGYNADVQEYPEPWPGQDRQSGGLISRDGGKTWRRCLALPRRDEYTVCFSAPDEQHLWVLVHRGKSNRDFTGESNCESSADGGRT